MTPGILYESFSNTTEIQPIRIDISNFRKAEDPFQHASYLIMANFHSAETVGMQGQYGTRLRKSIGDRIDTRLTVEKILACIPMQMK